MYTNGQTIVVAHKVDESAIFEHNDGSDGVEQTLVFDHIDATQQLVFDHVDATQEISQTEYYVPSEQKSRLPTNAATPVIEEKIVVTGEQIPRSPIETEAPVIEAPVIEAPVIEEFTSWTTSQLTTIMLFVAVTVVGVTWFIAIYVERNLKKKKYRRTNNYVSRFFEKNVDVTRSPTGGYYGTYDKKLTKRVLHFELMKRKKLMKRKPCEASSSSEKTFEGDFEDEDANYLDSLFLKATSSLEYSEVNDQDDKDTNNMSLVGKVDDLNDSMDYI